MTISSSGDVLGDGGDGIEASIQIAFYDDPTDPLFARANTSDGEQFAVYVERSEDGAPSAPRALSIHLADETIVTAVFDGAGRPVRFEDAESSVTVIYRVTDATVVYTNAVGETTEELVLLPPEVQSASESTAASRGVENEFLCTELLARYMSMVALVFDCSDAPDSPLCASVIALGARASLKLCSEASSIVPDEQLETDLATDPEARAPAIAISVVAVANVRNESGQAIVELDAVAFGGAGPYGITWEIVEGPVTVIIPDGAFTEVSLSQTGTYTIVVTATDSAGESATETIVVDILVEALALPLSVNAGADTTIASGAAIVLQGAATGGFGDYAYQWSPAFGLSNPNTPQPTLTLNSVGIFTYTLTVTDGRGTRASDGKRVYVVPALAADAGPNVTVDQESTATLLGSASGGDGDYIYQWTPAAGLSNPNTARPSLGAGDLSPGSYEFTLTVTDGTGSFATDMVTVSVNSPAAISPPGTTISSIKWGANFAAGGYQILVQFNNPMNPATAQTASNYRINGTATNPTTATLDADTRTITLTFAVPMKTSDRLDVSVGEAIQDGYGRAFSETLSQVIAANSSDTTAPTISSITWASGFAGPGYQLTVVFNEAMDQTTAETLANYRINGTAVNPTAASLGADGKTVTLTVTGLALASSDTLDVSVAGSITDINAGAKTQALAQAIAANAADVTAPTISSIAWASNFAGPGYQLTVVFNEAMDQTTAETLANYRINGTAVNPASASLGADGKTVTLTVTSLALATSDTLDVSVAGSITDINAGAKTQALAQAVAANAADVTAPTISTITWGSGYAGPGYQLTVVFSEAMDETTVETLANYRVNGTAVNPASASLGADGKTVTLTVTGLALATSDTLDVSLAGSITDINTRSKIEALGQAIADNTADVTKASVTSATETGVNQVTVVFDEVMDETTANNTANYTWTGTITTTAAVLQTNGTTVILTTSGDPSSWKITVKSVKDINGKTNNNYTSANFP